MDLNTRLGIKEFNFEYLKSNLGEKNLRVWIDVKYNR